MVAYRHPDGGVFMDSFEPHILGVVSDGVVGEVRQHDQRLLSGHPNRTIEAAACCDGARRKSALQAGNNRRQFGAFILRGAFGAGQFA